MIKNDTKQPIQFVLLGQMYTYIVVYPKSHKNSFINDLINIGMFVQKNELAVIKNINHFVVNWWMDREYEIELI